MIDFDKRMRQLGRLTRKATEKAREKAEELEEVANEGEDEDGAGDTERRRRAETDRRADDRERDE